MRLQLFLPTQTVVDEDVDKVSAEAGDGSFTLLPRHVDFATALVPGLLVYNRNGDEHLWAVNAGVLVKQGDTVSVSTTDAIAGDDPADLERAVTREFDQLDERESAAHLAVQKMEADFVRRFIQLEQHEAGP